MASFKKAQTLIESLAALGVLTMAMVAILSLGVASIYAGAQNRAEVAAVNLAREGIELLRGMRDSNWLVPGANPFAVIADGDWIVDISDSGVVDLTSADSGDINVCGNCQIYFKNGFYQHDLGVVTPYKRLITIATPAASKRKIISKVIWTVKNRKRNFSLETTLADWR